MAPCALLCYATQALFSSSDGDRVLAGGGEGGPKGLGAWALWQALGTDRWGLIPARPPVPAGQLLKPESQPLGVRP